MGDNAESTPGMKLDASEAGEAMETADHPSSPVDVPASGTAAGILMILAGPCSLGLTTTDPTNPSLLGVLAMLLGFGAAAYAFKRKRKPARICIVIFVVLTGLGAAIGLMIHPIAFLLRGGISCILGLCALAGLGQETQRV